MVLNVWPEWTIVEPPLGKGAGGTVYRAVHSDSSVKTEAAIKVISIPADPAELDALFAEGMDREQTRTYLQNTRDSVVNEINLMVSLKGAQNIVSVEDFKVVEKDDGLGWDIYIRMELLTSFSSYIQGKRLTEKEVIDLGCDICSALEVCERQGIIHRDIKPNNIFVSRYGNFKLGDFGIARTMENLSSGLSQNKGTANYMAPEVYRSGHYDSRADIYSLGLVLYRLLNDNQLPFLDAAKQLSPIERTQALERRLGGDTLPPPCNASPAMANLVLCACNANPDMRFRTATEMRQALEGVSSGTYIYRTTGVADSYDETVGVRNRAQAGTPDPSVRSRDNYQPVQAQSQRRAAPVRFGPTRSNNTKSVKTLVITMVAVILVGSAFFFVYDKVTDAIEAKREKDWYDVEEESSEVVKYSQMDEEQIASIISEAEALAAEEDHEGALKKIKIGLITYPGSENLLAKEQEYTGVLNAQLKATILEEAEALVEAGDYLGAIQTIEGGIATIGEDPELVYEKQSCEEPFAADVSTKVDGLLMMQDFDGADELLDQAAAVFPNNVTIAAKKELVKNSRPQIIVQVSPAFQYRVLDNREKTPLYKAYTNGRTFQMSGESYTDGFVLSETDEFESDPPEIKFNNRWYSYTFASFNLGGKYSALEFDMGHVDGTDSEDRALNVYVDDELVATLPLKFAATVQHMALDVTGAKQIRFEMLMEHYHTSRKNVSYGFGNFIGHMNVALPNGIDPSALGAEAGAEGEAG